MSFALEFLAEAADEVAEVTAYYETRMPGLGIRFRRQLESVCLAIAQHPVLWRERSSGHRRVNIPGFPHYIAFFIRGERVLIVAVGHGSRRPGYWQNRIESEQGNR